MTVMDLSCLGLGTKPLGKYRLLAELGEGGMARVFLAVAQGPSGFSKLVVVKVLRDQVAEEPSLVDMFLDEARLAGRLNHPNVVQTLEVLEDGGRHGLVMEYLEGQSFYTIVRRAHDMPLPHQLRVVMEALQGLHYAHELKDYDGTPLGLVHRDVSPQNIFVTYDGLVKVLDFGIAKAMTSSIETKAGEIKGKVGYMAPEQFLAHEIDRRADIHAMGVVLWQVGAGQRLWKGVPDLEIMQRVVQGDVPCPSEVNPKMNRELERITMKAIEHDPNKRYATALDLHSDLEKLLASLNSNATTRDVGRFVWDLFADDRRDLARTIDVQLTRARFDEESVEVPVIPDPARVSGPADSAYPAGRSGPPEPRVATPMPTDANLLNSDASFSSITNSIQAARQPPSHRTRTLVLGGLALAFAVLGIALFVVLPASVQSSGTAENSAPLASSSALPISSAVDSGAANEQETVAVRIETRPSDVNGVFDDVTGGPSPATRKVPKDGEVHHVRVEAEGDETRKVELTADRDRVLGIKPPPERSTGWPPRAARTKDESTAGRNASANTTPVVETTKPDEAETDRSIDARERIRTLDKSNPWQ